MRNTFLSILAGLLLLGAPGAAAAGSCQSANGCAMLEHDATANAKKAVLVDAAGTVAISGTAGVKANLVDASGDTAMDATANAVKTVVVDSAGTALVGGRGGRVELLYSGTSTDATGGAGVWVVDQAAFTPPMWCRNVMFTARIHALTIGPGANLLWAAVRYDSSGGIYTTSAGAERGMEPSVVAAPTVNNGVVLTIGLGVPSLNTTYTGTSVLGVPTLPFPKIGFSHNWATAPTSWTIRWAVYCSG